MKNKSGQLKSTPETDLNECWPASNLKLGDSSVVPAKFARKLERERDEAREELKEIAEYGTEEINAAVELRQKLASALIERDEAREDLEFRRGLYKVQEERLEKAERERDEAREAVKELVYIAERALDLAEIDFENDKFGVVSELRDGVEKIKEATK